MAGYGLAPVKNGDGGSIRANNFCDGNGYRIAATAPSAYFEGDLCTLTNGLLVTDMGSATAGTVIGAFYGAEYVDNSSGDVKFVRSIAASTVAKAQFKAYVYDNPYCIFKIQADQDTTALDATMVGNNLQIVASPSGSTTTFKSGLVADSSTQNTTQGFPLQFIGSAEVTDGSYTAAGTTMDILVKINTHLWGNAAGNTGLT
jgi:hypothetical protein